MGPQALSFAAQLAQAARLLFVTNNPTCWLKLANAYSD